MWHQTLVSDRSTWTCAPRDTNDQGSVNYPQNAEGGLNKFHFSYKKAMKQEAIDNMTKRNSEIYGLQPKSATNILNCEATLIEKYQLFPK